MEFLQTTLANGLEIVAECNDEAHSTALGFFVQTGARDETDDVSGVSHFLEHMVFKGTATRTADDVNREFDEMGAHYNAFTSEENTVYYAAVLPEFQIPGRRAVGRHSAARAARGGFRHREAGDHRRDQDVRGSAAVRGRRQMPGGPFRPAIRWAAACWARSRASAAAGRGDAGVFRPPLQPAEYRAGRRRPDRFRRPGRDGRASVRRLGAIRGAARREAGLLALRLRSDSQTDRDAGIPAANVRRPFSHRRRPLRRQAADDDARRRLRQPALLGTGRSGPGGKLPACTTTNSSAPARF